MISFKEFLTEVSKKDVKDFEEYISKTRGWAVEEAGKHRKYYHKKITGPNSIVIGSKTPSDPRSLKNSKSLILQKERQAGVNLNIPWTLKV